MSERNVELHRRALEVFNQRDLDAFLPLVHPDIEYHPVLASISGVEVYRGYEGVRRWFADFDEVFGDDVHVEPEAFFDLGEQTLVFYTLHARGRQSGAPVAMPFAQALTWENHLTVKGVIYTDREEALRDLGVSQDELEPLSPRPDRPT